MAHREGCPDLDPMWPGTDGRPRGLTLCVLYPRCKCGDADKRRCQAPTPTHRPEVP